MDQVSFSHSDDAHIKIAARRVAKGYSLENLAVATGLTIDEIDAVEAGVGSDHHVERIESVLR